MPAEISINKFIKYIVGLNYTTKIIDFNKHFYTLGAIGKFTDDYDDIPGLFVYPEIYPKSKLLTLNVYAHHTGRRIRLFVVDFEHQNHIYQTKDLNQQFNKITTSDNQAYLKKILHDLTDDLMARAKLLKPQKHYSTKYRIRVNESFGDPLYTFDFNGIDLNDKNHILNCLIQNKFYLSGNEWYFNRNHKSQRKTKASSLPPTKAQLKYLDYLTYAVGENQIRPHTMSEAGFHINRLKIKKNCTDQMIRQTDRI